MSTDSCPCGLGPPYASCCRPFHAGWDTPKTAERLMRSRYAAYAVQDIAWLEQTSGGEARATFSARDAAAWAKSAAFTKLEVLEVVAGGEADVDGVVQFAATFVEHGKTQVLSERSRFERATPGDVTTPWRYVGREKLAPTRAAAKTGRNDPCPCGSGQKYKKCCGA